MERIKYTVASVQQQKLLELNLDIKDAFILSYLKDTIGANSKFISKIVGNEIYYWLKYSSLITYLPILKIESEKVLARRFSEYEKLGLLKRHIHRVTDAKDKTFVGNYTFFRLTEKFSELFEENKVETDINELEKVAKEMGLTVENNRRYSKVLSEEPRVLKSSFGEILETTENTVFYDENLTRAEGTQKFRYNTIINNTNINNTNTTTNINNNSVSIDNSGSSSLVSDNSLLDKENIRSIKLALQNHGLGIETCKNIMELVYAKKVGLTRIKQVLVVAQMKQWRDGAIYQALRDNWNLETPESATPEVVPNPEELSAKISWLKKFAGIWGDKELRAEFEKLVINIPLELLEKNKSKMSKMTIFEMKNCLINLKKGA